MEELDPIKEIEPDKELTEKQDLFCQLFASDREFFGNGTQAYIEAYNIDITNKGSYNAARASASNLLTKTNILKRINEILEEGGLNNAQIDKQLAFLIAQNADFSAKINAIKEYNKLKQRITEKVDLTSKGEQIKQIQYIIPDGNTNDSSNEQATSGISGTSE